MRPDLLATEVLAADNGRGSGLLVGSGLVLTSLHVLLGERPPEEVPPGIAARVRFYGDLIAASRSTTAGWDRSRQARELREKKVPWHRARLLWPPAGSPAGRHDVALLAMDYPEATTLTPPSLLRGYAFQDGQRNRHVDCVGEGFPQFRMERLGGAEVWELESLSGSLLMTERRADPSRRISVSSDPPDDADGWRGLSGAALWVDAESRVELIGVAHTRTPALRFNNEIRCWPLATIPSDDPFWQLSGIMPPAAQRVAKAAVKPVSAALKDGFFRFDRQRATSHFRGWLRGAAAGRSTPGRVGPPRRPAVVLLTGHRFDEPMLCAERLAEIVAEEAYPQRRDVYRSPIPLSCGPADDSADIRLDSLLRQWARSYGTLVAPLRADFKELLRPGLSSRDRSRLILVEHDDSCFGPHCTEVLEGVLDILSCWEPDDAEEAAPPVVMLVAVSGREGGPRETGFDPRTNYPEKIPTVRAALEALRLKRSGDEASNFEWCLDLPDLGAPNDPKLKDITSWLEEIEQREPISIPDELSGVIEHELMRHEEFPVRFAKYAVEDAIAKQGGM